MSKTVFILGAGASKEAGAPLMSELPIAIRDMANTGGNDFNLIREAMQELRLTHFKSYVDIDNLEDVFSAFEMAELTGKLGSLASVKGLTDKLKYSIQYVLGNAIIFPIDTKTGKIKPSESYKRFANMIRSIQKMNLPQSDQRVSILTFNYDPCLDDALISSNVGFDYCLNDTNTTGMLPLLKIHGSLNWVQCQECGMITYWDIGKALAEVRFFKDDFEDNELAGYKLWNVLNKHHKYKCGHTGSSHPFIVPPTYNKRSFHESIASVWSAAARELADAENIYIIGFSLPPTDRFFHDLYAVGTIGPADLRRFWVFNPDEAVEERFRNLVGRGVDQAFKFHKMKFLEAIDTISGIHILGSDGIFHV